MTAPSSEWRLKTPGGIPFKYVSMEGSASYEQSVVDVVILVETSRYMDLLLELYPISVNFGTSQIPSVGLQLAGVPGLLTKDVTFRSHDDGLPIDPFDFDSMADQQTYHPIIEVTVTYEANYTAPDPNDPTTYLEVTGASATSVFTVSGSGKMRWQLDNGATEDNSDPSVPGVIIDTRKEWSFKWPRLNYLYFWNVLKPALDFHEGKVNSTAFRMMTNAPPETILLASYNYSQSFDWLSTFFAGVVTSQPSAVTVEIKVIEKNARWKGEVRGHNHFYRPGEGWQRLLVDGVNPAYESSDLNLIFGV